MLEHKIIVYDDSCPMCKLYTQGFVRLGILKPDHRIGFARADAATIAPLDLDRARHEIPLLDTQTGEVTYGMDALFLLIGHRFPCFSPLFRLRLFRALVYSLYQIVTYNRRVIAGCAPPREGFDCAPDFNRVQRLRYLRLAVAAWAILLLLIVRASVVARHPMLALFLLGIGLVQGRRLWQTGLRRCTWDRAGSLASNHLLFSLLLVPSLLPLPDLARGANVGVAIALTLADALRRENHCKRCPDGTQSCLPRKREKPGARQTGPFR